MRTTEPVTSLRITGVYQDTLTRHWAIEVYHKVARLAGADQIEDAWWKISLLSQAKMLREAVEAAIRADILVVAVHAAKELPSDLYGWIHGWLPRRGRRVGALIALIGVPELAGAEGAHTQDYLQAIARRAGLDFLPDERKAPFGGLEWDEEQVVATPDAATRGLLDRVDRHDPAYREWGINE